MPKNKLKDIWAAGQPALNGWCSIGNPFTAEIMAAAGYDSVTVDMQHGALDYASVLPMFQAMRGSGVVPMARVPWLDPGQIMKALDAGALGIICPMVNSRDEAEEFVRYMRYPPLGQRSFGPTRANIAYGGYAVTEANEQVLALAMIETAEGMANLEEIAATPGLDGIYVGPADLTLGTQEGRLAHRAVGPERMFGAGQQLHHGVLGDRDGIDVADDGERNRAPVQRVEIDRVVADTVARHDLQVRGLRDGLGRERLGANDQRIGFVDQGSVRRFADLLDIVDRHAFSGEIVEKRLAGGVEFAGNEQMGHQDPPFGSPAAPVAPVRSRHAITEAPAAAARNRESPPTVVSR